MNDKIRASVREILTQYLELNNHRKTPERYAILDAVYGIKGLFSLETLGEKLMSESKFLVSRATLYNTLKLFLELRLVVRHKFLKTTMYEACYEKNNACHQVCTVCGKVTEISLPAITRTVDDFHLKRFHKDGYSLYIYGICSSCAASITRRMNLEKKQKHKKNEK